MRPLRSVSCSCDSKLDAVQTNELLRRGACVVEAMDLEGGRDGTRAEDACVLLGGGGW